MMGITPMKRHTARNVLGSLLLATMLTLSGCGPIMSLLCIDQKQTDMDCSTDQTRAPPAP
jgi:uncharacterized protein YceK